MPGAGQRVGQDVGQSETVGVLTFDLIMRGDRTQQDLHQEQRKHHPEIFRRRAHRRRDAQQCERIGGRDGVPFVAASVGDRVVPAEQRDAQDQEQHAEGRPDPQCRRRRVAYQRFAGPVVGVGDFLADHAGLIGDERARADVGAFGGGRPCGPPEERGQRAAMLQRSHRAFLHRIRFAKFCGRGIVAEQADVVRSDIRDRRCAILGEGDGFGGGVVGVGAHHALQPAAQGGLLFDRQLRIAGAAIVAAGPDIQDFDGFAMQPVGAPVGRDIGAMAPDRSQLHAAHRLPDLPALFDVGAGVNDRPLLGRHFFRHRRRGAEDFAAGPQQYRKGTDQQDGQRRPELAGVAHGGLHCECSHGGPCTPDVAMTWVKHRAA